TLNFPGEPPRNNRVQNNTIGARLGGNAALPNGTGVQILLGAGDNLVGGDHGAAEGNLISGNTLAGVLLRDAGTSGNRVQGNFIGTKGDGSGSLANGSGVILLAPSNFVGGAGPGEGNVISGNQVRGILLNGAGSTGNQVQGNFIGINLAGAAVPNQGSGVVFRAGAHHNPIG